MQIWASRGPKLAFASTKKLEHLCAVLKLYAQVHFVWWWLIDAGLSHIRAVTYRSTAADSAPTRVVCKSGQPAQAHAISMQFTINAPTLPKRYERPAAFAAFDEDQLQAAPQGEKPSRDREECRRDGCTLAAAGRWGAALELFDEALAIGGAPDPWVLHELRAQALLGLDRCFEAARAAELSIAGAPDWAPAHATRARALLNFGRSRARPRPSVVRYVARRAARSLEGSSTGPVLERRLRVEEGAPRRRGGASNSDVAEVSARPSLGGPDPITHDSRPPTPKSPNATPSRCPGRCPAGPAGPRAPPPSYCGRFRDEVGRTTTARSCGP